jgi:hypothetical protein
MPCGNLPQCKTDNSHCVKVTLRLRAIQSISLGVEPHLGLMTRYYCLTVTVLSLGCALSEESTGLSLVSQSAVLSQLSVCTIIYFLHVSHVIKCIYNISLSHQSTGIHRCTHLYLATTLSEWLILGSSVRLAH